MKVSDAFQVMAFPSAMSHPHEPERHVNEACYTGILLWSKEREQHGDQSDRCHGRVLDHRAAGQKQFDGVEFQGHALPPRIPMQDGEERVDRDKSQAIDHHEFTHLRAAAERRGVLPNPSVGKDGEKEFERVDVKEHDEQQGCIDDDRSVVMQTVSAEELVMGVPEQDEQNEADGERDEATQRVVELDEGVRDFERDDEQRNGESEDDIGEGIDTRKGSASKTETIAVSVFMKGQHRWDSVARDARDGWKGQVAGDPPD